MQFGAPMSELFRAQKIGTAGGRSPDMKNLDSEIVVEGTDSSAEAVQPNKSRVQVYNPNVLAQAIVDIPDLGLAESSDWRLGLSRTIYEDAETWQFEKSSISSRMTEMTGGPVLDVADTGSMFDDSHRENGIHVNKAAGRRFLFEINDQPLSMGMVKDPPGHEYCTPSDRLQFFRREMDFSVFLLAHEASTQQVYPLAYASYRQLTEMHVSWAGEEPRFHFSEAGRPEVTQYGGGAGHRLPEFSKRADKLANDFQGAANLIETAPCDNPDSNG